MIAASELESCPIFACLSEPERERFAARAADVRLGDEEWLIREGELPYLFVLLEGRLKLLKDLLGRSMDLHEYGVGEWFGEVPILLRGPAMVSIRAVGPARVARFDPQQLFELNQRIVTRTRAPGEEEVVKTRDADGLFVMIGADASTDWLPKSIERDERGYIYTGRDIKRWSLERDSFPLETSLPGVFCAGDVRHDSIKRVSSGVGEGSMAIAFIHQYLAMKNF